MSTTERSQIEKRMSALSTNIAAKRAELQRLQSGWTEDTFVTGRMRQEIGALQQEWTTLAQRQAALVSVDEASSSRGTGQIFFGSSF